MPIVWTLPDGSVHVMTLSEKYLAQQRRDGESTRAAVGRLAELERAKNPVLASATPSIVATADIPTDRSARLQWRLSNGRVEST